MSCVGTVLRRRLWAQPDDAARLVGKRVADAVHPTGFGHWEYAAAIEYAIGQQKGGAPVRRSAAPTPDWRRRAAMPWYSHVRAAMSGQWSAADRHACQASWPLLAPNNLFAARESRSSAARATVCAFGDALRPYVLRTSGMRSCGWRRRPADPAPIRCSLKRAAPRVSANRDLPPLSHCSHLSRMLRCFLTGAPRRGGVFSRGIAPPAVCGMRGLTRAPGDVCHIKRWFDFERARSSAVRESRQMESALRRVACATQPWDQRDQGRRTKPCKKS